MIVQWLGGPKDGTFIEVPEGSRELKIAENKRSEPTYKKYTVPIRTFCTIDDNDVEHHKLILDYYAKA